MVHITFYAVIVFIIILCVYLLLCDKKKETKTRSVIIYMSILFASILVWQGLWSILDDYLFHHNKLYSNIISIVLGLTIIILAIQVFPDKVLAQG